MAKKQRPKTIQLDPNIVLRSGALTARCRRAWQVLLEKLYASETGAETFDLAVWETAPTSGRVRLTPRCSTNDESKEHRKGWEVCFQIHGLAKAFKNADSEQARNKLRRDFHQWMDWAIVSSFLSEKVEIDYSYFNLEELPFSVLATDQDRGLHRSDFRLLLRDFGGLDAAQLGKRQDSLLKGLSLPNVRTNRKRVVMAREPKRPKPKVRSRETHAASWRRFYFDDGQTRVFWYIQNIGETQTIVQGPLGAEGRARTKKFKSPKETKTDTQRRIDEKLTEGFVPYDPKSIRYARKHRRALKLIKKAMAEFERELDLRIPPEYRRYLLEVNGGRPEPGTITLPGHARYKRAEVQSILGFKPSQMTSDIDYYHAVTRLPPGHVPVADGEHFFSLDQLGAVHFWDTRQLQRADQDDDNVTHFDRMESFIVAGSFDEFLTRISRFPDDTRLKLKVQTPQAKRKAVKKRVEKAIKEAEAQPLRRFFYDDGELRKYWSIHLRGKAHTTQYGRFGRLPGETTKTFDTAREAAASAEKLTRQKLGKGYREVIPESLQLERPSGLRRASSEAIQKLEQHLGTELPEEYKHFLRTRNGGAIERGGIAIPGIPYIANVCVDYVYGLYPKSRVESLWSAIELHRSVLPKGHLPIASGADTFTLALNWNRGCIYFWNHESDVINENTGRFLNSAGHLLAHSFDEFLTRIALHEAEHEDV